MAKKPQTKGKAANCSFLHFEGVEMDSLLRGHTAVFAARCQVFYKDVPACILFCATVLSQR